MANSTSSDNYAPKVGNAALRPGRVLAVVSLGYGMIVIDISIVNVAIPAIRSSLHASLATMQLVVDAYVIVLASLVLAGAAAVGRYGAVPMFRLGIAVFGVTSLLCGAAPDGAVLVAMRAAQGLGAVLLVPATLVMLSDTYKDPNDRAKAVAVWAMVAGSPVAFGPILGGALVAAVGWRSIFFVNVPVVLVTLWLSARHMPRSEGDKEDREDKEDKKKEPQDVPGQFLAIVFLGGVALALTEGRELGWTAPLPVVASVTALVAFAAFVVRQRTYAFPMIPSDLFRAPGFRGFVTVGLLLFTGYYGLVFSISVFLQQVHGYGPVATGLCFLPSALPITFMPLVAGRVNAGLGPLRVLVVATFLTLVGGLLLIVVGGDAPIGVGIGLTFIGLGFGLATVPQITLVMATAPQHRMAIASGLLSAARQSGTMIGVALIGGLQSGDNIAAPALAAVVAYLLMAVAAGLGGRRLPAHTA
ncbi:MFS transporter [Embleya sp. NBC_00896]|uniref:MFS transporter n=1 Tax=Embleya sp. NBC_00896 TaxID=2975961 RepID=UPI003864359A|nr:MFS transporter [Embleya sp. NBC_00896]